MKRAAVFLEEKQIKKAKVLGRQINAPWAAVIRNALDFYFRALEDTDIEPRLLVGRLTRFIGQGEKEPEPTKAVPSFELVNTKMNPPGRTLRHPKRASEIAEKLKEMVTASNPRRKRPAKSSRTEAQS